MKCPACGKDHEPASEGRFRSCWWRLRQSQATAPAPAAPPRPAVAGNRMLPCVHLGEALSGYERQRLGLAHALDWRECDKGHGNVCPCQQCQSCGDYVPAAAVELAGRIEAEAPQPRAKDDPLVRAAYRHLLHEAIGRARAAVYPAGRFAGRGVVIPAGGVCKGVYSPEPQPYFWGAMAVAYAARRRGCTLPIQFWFLAGELEPWMPALAARVGAACIDAQAAGVQQTMRCPRGWQLKVHALMNSPWREVIHLDADNVPAIDVAELFEDPAYRDKGALFWADNPGHWSGHLTSDHWDRLGVPDRGKERDFESGQIVLDKARTWPALQVIKHLADHAEYWGGFNGGAGGVWYGDKTDFHAGFAVTGTPYHLFTGWHWDAGGFYRHHDSRGRLAFQHCCHRKGHLANGHEIPNLDGNAAVWEAARFARTPLPWLEPRSPVPSAEDLVEVDRLVNPERHFDLFAGDAGQCRTVWLDVVARDEYRLGGRFRPGARVLDVGANCGAFSYAAMRRGAERVLAFEPYPESRRKAQRNLAGLGVEVRGEAVWRSDVAPGLIPLHPHQGEAFTGGYSTVLSPSDPGWDVPCVGLDDVLREMGRVELLKIDCEGAEWPILYTATQLGRVEAIAGEYHADALPALAGPAPAAGWPAWSPAGLRVFLEALGFAAEALPASAVHGLFWARRK